jgi:hypothetical protein
VGEGNYWGGNDPPRLEDGGDVVRADGHDVLQQAPGAGRLVAEHGEIKDGVAHCRTMLRVDFLKRVTGDRDNALAELLDMGGNGG